ncbi:general stress protein [Oenococcus oeni]|uniref:polysaccharide pyruvyl transferase family protein n=1 Tax=Oenococcus oeni TaxID=1247 RepID=UPI0008F9657D|nr:polysaccharide pyruvyl transferase family protein [Oenococcus oeni]OIL70726.1 general stress protein [Oenococcus oeni]OIM48968.1 general stress protein [Oenococcus oeni]OLQ37656.1 general stress protein [Oenococcus oeni]
MSNFFIKGNKTVTVLPTNGRAKFFAFGIPNYTNLGDQAVSLASRKYIEKEFSEYEYIEILEENNDEGIEAVKKIITSQDIVSFVGGGNMGSLYTDHESARRKVFSTFINNLTISFPESINFEDNPQGQKELKLSQEAYNKNPHLYLVARDAQSYHRMQTTFKSHVLFTPDMVLYLNPRDFHFERSGALFALRRDGEKVIKDELVEELKDLLDNGQRPIKQTDTVLDDVDRITPLTREKLFDQELELFAHQEMIITDRWHAMVFSVLTGTPCLLFGNSYGKGKHAYFDWLEHINWIDYTDESDPERLKEAIHRLMNSKTHDFDLHPDFEQLHRVIARHSNIIK